MALHAHDYGRASALPLSAVLASIPSYPRPVIERLVSHLIDQLDEQDGEVDREEDDPAEDGNDAEREEGVINTYGIDQRIAAVGHGYAPWHIDREEVLG